MSNFQPYDTATAYGQPSQYPGGAAPQGMAPAYPYNAYGSAVQPEHPQSMTILILGILGLVLAGVLGPVAWIMGNKAKKECDSGMYRITDNLKIGRVLGIVASVMLIVAVVLVVLMVLAIFVFSLAAL